MITLIWKLTEDQPTRKVWISTDGLYCVVWRREAFGISVDPLYIAFAFDGVKCWEIISRHRKEFPAKTACQKYARQKAKAKPERKRSLKKVQRGIVFKEEKKKW
jgi:hypothetical protein